MHGFEAVEGDRVVEDNQRGRMSLPPAPPGRVPPPPLPAASAIQPLRNSVQTAPPISNIPPPATRINPGKAAPPVPHTLLSKGAKPVNKAAGARSDNEQDKSSMSNDLINIHWKPASGQNLKNYESEVIMTEDQDQFLRPFSRVSSSELGRLVRDNPLPDLLIDSHSAASIFDGPSTGSSFIATDALKQYFAKKQNTKFDSASLTHSSVVREEGGGKKTGLDRERVKLIALALGGAISSRTNRRALFRQYRESIIRCDYQMITTDIMCPLLQLLKSISDEEQSACLSYVLQEVRVSSSSEAVVLEDFEEPDVFIYEMSKIPEVKVRLECMIFERTFEDLFQLTVGSLNVIYAGLEVLSRNLNKIAKLFQLILQTGNFLNRGSKLGGSQLSFSLSSLAKLTEVKSSVDPKLDVLHFILSHIPPEEAVLFSDDEVVKLRNASNLRCYRVRDEVKDLLDSIVAVSEIVKHPIQSAGEDDRFTLRMTQFSQRIKGTDQWLSKYAYNVFASYKRLSLYFEDSKSVYPPPKEKSPDQFDIIELFAWFSGIVKSHEKEVKKRGLRTRIFKQSVSTSPPADIKEASPTASMSPPEGSPSPISTTTVKPGGIDFNYTLEAAKPGASNTVTPFGSSGALRPSLTKEQLQSSLSSLGSPAAPPLVAIINRGNTGQDLTASKPKLSPIVSSVIDVLVTPAGSPPTTPKAQGTSKPVGSNPGEAVLKPPPFPAVHDGSRRVLSMKELATGTPGKSIGGLAGSKPHILITPQGHMQRHRTEVSISVVPGLSKPEPTRKSEENLDFAASRFYPSRNEDSFPNYAVLNSRQSLSNTISRVAMLLSPTKEENGIYKGTRRGMPSLASENPAESE